MADPIHEAQNIQSISQAQRLKRTNVPLGNSDATKFDQILHQEQTQLQREIKFSQHAQSRLEERSIQMNDQDYLRLQSAIQKINDKGGKDSLVLMDDRAFVVNAPNQTVITAMDSAAIKENVFTNIDSAIII